MADQPLKEFLNRWVKILYNDGGVPHATRGKLISVIEGFATIETPGGNIAISLREILKISEQNNERGEKR